MSLTVANLLQEVALLREVYDGVHLRFRHHAPSLVGELEFRAKCGGIELHDSYSIEIEIPKDYPGCPPATREMGGRIPRDADHHVYPDGTLCLGPPIQVIRDFRRKPTLLGYVEGILIPILFWHSHNEMHRGRVLGAYSHGDKGVAEYRAETDLGAVYCEILGVSQLSTVLQLLELTCKDTLDSAILCPCKSGETLEACHGPALQGLLAMRYFKKTDLALDYWYLKERHGHERRRGVKC